MKRKYYKDQCDSCGNFNYLVGYGTECLCLECILKILNEGEVIDMDGLERIRTLASEISDKPLQKIVKYLLTRKDMNDKFLSEEKSLSGMVDFIRQEVRKTAKNGWNWIDDDEIYGLAIHYFDETNENLKNSNDNSWDYRKANKEIQEEKKEQVTQIIEKKETKKIVPIIQKKKEWIPEGQLSLFDVS